MCTNQREIINKYTGHKLYVKCGHCPACLQEKAAHRVLGLKQKDSPLTDTIMCTLTYREMIVLMFSVKMLMLLLKENLRIIYIILILMNIS